MSVEKLNNFRSRYETIHVLSPEVRVENQKTHIALCYQIDKEFSFQTSYELPFTIHENDRIVQTLLRYLAIVESFSYWKLMCPKKIEVPFYKLDEKEVSFFKNVLKEGMSEFLYRNKLPLDIDVEFVSKNSEKSYKLSGHSFEDRGSLILIGGGKDSIVTLELLKSFSESEGKVCVPFSLNPIQASLDTVRVSEVSHSIFANRKIDSQLKELNNRDFFNGHIPFSAVLSFVSSIVAYGNNLGTVYVSNESSANQGNVVVDGHMVNHQYSKSFDYESSLRDLFAYKNIPISYVSFLRPLSELQISKVFSELKKYHTYFQSCNARQTLIEKERRKDKSSLEPQDRWCGSCPKCIFVYIMLRPFLHADELLHIFGSDLEKAENFKEMVQSLSGKTSVKPFECVGTFEEVEFAVEVVKQEASIRQESINKFVSTFDENHFLGKELFAYLKESVQR